MKSFDCGNIKGVGYPFLGSDRPDYCGYPGFELGCSNQDPEITIMRSTYKLLGINSHGTAPSLTSYLTTRNNRVEVPALQSAIVPILVSPTVAQLLGAINQGFELEWSVWRSLETVHSKLDLAQQVLSLVPLWDAGSWPLYNGGQEKLP
ncbi:hypothetical protein NC653_038849 [Populus alba x Populus x berolinensis]|uniref:Wall-associated receptor kinase galacturonan-binding domain-containing protein n=1 Tax=Populus alba x Populus x berolinensis TaxID=444605 RepID=A0AAD6PUA5_9ROSI|nr:hypothetical protein NC653_038501 [Populus alba x Populus x berolinensis]KAJ6960496.1 hypothetical protein NC653_038507 [Populus alba x Populus x berolinensis]KAJ6960504.1 hypothetical protein NC653_038513 [Populus alba x Populus x berolinensis]KAJ6960968.1 hypothetical protein NC653_038849 [Populus alba x Populus x berolinensis]